MTAALWHEDAESAVLGAMLIDTPATLRSAAVVRASDFHRTEHRVLFEAMVSLVRGGAAVESVALFDELRRNGTIERSGGPEYLSHLVDAVASSANVEHHARIVRDYALRRAVITEAHAAAELAKDLSQPVEQSLVRLVDRLATAARPETMGSKTFDQELWGVLEDVERQAQFGDRVTGVGSGINRLDDLTDGWVPGRLIVIAARPKKGKTSIGLNFAREACRAETSVYFATAEQPRRELLKRCVALEANANLRAITSPHLLEMQTKDLAKAAAEIKGWPIYFDETSRTPAEIRLGIQRRQVEDGPVGLVVIDYLGKYHSGVKAERHDLEIGKLTGSFADMAIKLNVPVILLAQLNRASVRDGQERRPGPSDLRDGGAIEQDAAQVVFLYRDPKAEEAFQDPNWMQLLLDLNRFGPTGDVDVSFSRETGRWRQWLRLAS